MTLTGLRTGLRTGRLRYGPNIPGESRGTRDGGSAPPAFPRIPRSATYKRAASASSARVGNSRLAAAMIQVGVVTR